MTVHEGWWAGSGQVRQPYYICAASDDYLAMAGLWEAWRSPEGELVRTCCVITTEANELVAGIHDRMPVIIAPEHWQAWLEAPAAEASSLVGPCPAAALRLWPVGRRVNKAGEDDPGLIEPVPE